MAGKQSHTFLILKQATHYNFLLKINNYNEPEHNTSHAEHYSPVKDFFKNQQLYIYEPEHNTSHAEHYSPVKDFLKKINNYNEPEHNTTSQLRTSPTPRTSMSYISGI